jgi:O-antigen ligase
LGFLPSFVLILLWLISCASFLPAKWFASPDWRTALVSLGAALPSTRTPQPWLTLEAIALFSIGLVWTYYVLVQQFNLRTRNRLWMTYGIAILGLAAAMTISSALKIRIPFWPETEHFGFFPNRNQTSNVLAVGGIMIYALGLQRLQDNERDWWIWLYSLALIFWALIINYSRAGIILFFLGAIVWHSFWIYRSAERRRPAIALAGLLFLVAVLAMVGGPTLARFKPGTSDALVPTEPARLAIQHDALLMSAKAPLLGMGLANFGALFSPAKKFYDLQKAAIHPESDVLWIAVELGWIPVVLLAIFFGWWIRQCLPFVSGTEQRLRAAAMIAVCVFVVHGFFDVSGHRIGAIWPALFLASTAIHPKANFKPSKWIPPVFRLFGVVFIIIGTTWLGSICGLTVVPTSARLEPLKQEIDSALTEGDFPLLLRSATETVRIAPLNWNGYHTRAVAEIMQHSRSSAKRDSAIAQYLMPFWPDLLLKEGIAWAAAGDPDEAFAVWTKMFERFPNDAPGLYREIYQLAKEDIDLLDRWRVLGRENKECLLLFFRLAGAVEFRIELDRLLAADPELRQLDSAEKGVLFRAWYDRGDKLELAQALRDHPRWEQIGWRELAHTYGDYGDYRSACEIVHKYAQPPPIPDLPSGASLPAAEIQARLYLNDANAAAYLCVALAKSGRIDQSLAKIEAIRGRPGSPAYLATLEAQLWEGKGDWRKAWNALASFANW